MMAERPSALVLGLTVDLLVLRLALVLAFGFAGDLRDEVVTLFATHLLEQARSRPKKNPALRRGKGDCFLLHSRLGQQAIHPFYETGWILKLAALR